MFQVIDMPNQGDPPSLGAMSVIMELPTWFICRVAFRTVMFPSFPGVNSYAWKLTRHVFDFRQAFHQRSSNDRSLTCVVSKSDIFCPPHT